MLNFLKQNVEYGFQEFGGWGNGIVIKWDKIFELRDRFQGYNLQHMW